VPSVEQHYDQVLSDIYVWMLGGFDAALLRNRELLAKLGVAPHGSRLAIDLGAGCGFQSIPLAELGFTVMAIDLDRKLLDELRARSGGLSIEVVRDDLQRFDTHTRGGAELVVCMLDTLLHLESKDAVRTLLAKVHAALEPGGKLIVTFRDLSRELTGLDRFLPVRSDDETILTCFLEYEPETVKVHDLLYRKEAAGWTFYKSYYRKLRLAPEWVQRELRAAGFGSIDSSIDRGLFTMIAVR
jgi:SAM-dependent methyltransferase